jgi:hypothetical protein|tara:strand:+ start:367 stop:570 length:204 start_codon:yes stop_codon:yes gene_type:complete
MADKTSKSFDELIKIIKEFKIKADDLPEPEEYKIMEQSTLPSIFDGLTSDEKENLWIWLNKDNIPQA